MENEKLQKKQENSERLFQQSEVGNKGTSSDQLGDSADNKAREDKEDKSNFIKIDRFSNKNQNSKTVEHCTRWWIFSFTISLILLFVIVLGFALGKELYYDFVSANNEIKVEHYNGNYEWGIYLVLAIMGGLVGYALYLVKGVHDAEEYERKKNLEIDRKLYHEKVMFEMNQEYVVYQRQKDEWEQSLRMRQELHKENEAILSCIKIDNHKAEEVVKKIKEGLRQKQSNDQIIAIVKNMIEL